MAITGKEFEELITAVEEAVHDLPGVKVQHNVKLTTNYGGVRQIDILIDEERGRFNYKTIIECKNTKSKVTVNTVGAFKDLLESVGAHQGIIVSAAGFQKGALKAAQSANIFLYQFSQIEKLEHHLKNDRFNVFELSHVSKDFIVRFKEKKSINKDITINLKLFSPMHNRDISILEVTEDFLNRTKTKLSDLLLRQITVPEKIQVIEGLTKMNVVFTVPLILKSDEDSTEITGFETSLHTSFFTAPTHIKDISVYKDVLGKKTHAWIYDVEFGGESFKILKKEI